MQVLPSDRGRNHVQFYRSASTQSESIRRRGEVVDTLVFLIAGLLLPAWLLGHLFLTFYPAPETDGSTVASGSMFGEGDSTEGSSTKGSSTKGNSTDGSSTKGGSQTKGDAGTPPGDETSGAANLQLSALTEKSTLLESEVETLTDTNGRLQAEIEQLKASASNMLQLDQADTAAADELRSKLASQTEQLNSAKQSLFDAEDLAKRNEQEKLRIQTALTELQSKLEKTEASLAAAKLEQQNQTKNTEGSPFATAPMEAASNDDANANLLAEANSKVNELSASVKELSYNLENTNSTLTQREEELQQTKLALKNIQLQNDGLKTALEEAKKNTSVAAAPAAPMPSVGQLRVMPREVYRDFVSSKGSISKMAFIRWEGDDIIVRSFANKRLYRLTLDRFSAADQEYLNEQKK